MDNKIKNNNKTFNKIPGLQILRMILSFWIVVNHCCIVKNPFFEKILYSQFHVPTFFIISFFFFYHNLKNRNIDKIKGRFERLLIPYIIWPIIILIFNNLLLMFSIKGRFNQNISLNDLIIQLIFGITIHPIFWFQFYLIFLTLLYVIISFIFKKKFLLILQILLIISYMLMYSGIVYNYFIQYQKKYNRYFGAIIEIIPYTVTGLTLSALDLICKIKKKLYIFFFNSIIIYFILVYNIFNGPKGFRFPGIKFNIGGICLFISFSIIPLDKIKNRIIISFIKLITSYTGGIYYLHDILRDYLNKKIIIIKKKEFLGGVFIYLLTYIICFFGKNIFWKSNLKNLFI